MRSLELRTNLGLVVLMLLPSAALSQDLPTVQRFALTDTGLIERRPRRPYPEASQGGVREPTMRHASCHAEIKAS
jgi:hypothetical protein